MNKVDILQSLVFQYKKFLSVGVIAVACAIVLFAFVPSVTAEAVALAAIGFVFGMGFIGLAAAYIIRCVIVDATKPTEEPYQAGFVKTAELSGTYAKKSE